MMKTLSNFFAACVNPSTTWVFAAIGVGMFLGIWAAPPSVAFLLTDENGVVETATMALFAGASLLCAYYVFFTGAFQTKPSLRYYFLLWAVLCFVFCGEEISWGQHWLGFGTPELLSSNVQGEANLHNLPWLTPRVVDGLSDFITSQGAFYVGFFVYFLLLPLASRWQPIGVLLERLKFPTLRSGLLMAIWLPIALSFLLALVTQVGPTRDALTELREFYFAFSIFLYAMVLTTLRAECPESQAG